MESKWKYNLKSHEVKEQPTMNNPQCHFGFGGGIDEAEFEEYYLEYNKHIASLRSIPVSGIVSWIDGEDVTGKFIIYQDERQIQYDNGEWSRIYELVDFAIPIKQEQPQLSEAAQVNIALEKTYAKVAEIMKGNQSKEQPRNEDETPLWETVFEIYAESKTEVDFILKCETQFTIKRK